MNRLLITELGDAMRHELIKQEEQKLKKTVLVSKDSLPEIKSPSIINSLLLDVDDNPLYRKSLSDVALMNLTKAANISLNGSQSKDVLEQHIREDLQIQKKNDYLNNYLNKQVEKILDDKNLMTKRKRYLLGELRRIEIKENNLNIKNRISTDQSQLSTIVEDTDRENKLMAIINTEGKLLQLQRRYEKKKQDDEALKLQVKNNYSKHKDIEDMHIEAMPILTQEQLEQGIQNLYHNSDLSEHRFQQRLLDKHKEIATKVWKQYHYPKRHKKWIQIQKKVLM
ncbi:unnamed protein product (macronuclear) [Paramecium tetraurelia]|uniref:Uncharacterized protein n=1 Tax=Paramecium tetraurelia TaxID=5888 RepID=A0C2S9_PARTE|nr:uncharacterized protein GSPATT00034574001 [Paramecium tetraurelia]CAK65096.1 unnamed protein product [Paramecium tetraurelia]|eukprot:XP_001432493.1 hypothetical protein (macronuclear) [Paramecium tetraurelia strain d4-2]